MRRLAAVVAATPHIAERFAAAARRTVNVSNFPFLDELAPASVAVPRESKVCYVGGITRTRGATRCSRAGAGAGRSLLLCGRFEDAALEAEMRAAPGWSQVDYLGQVGRDQVREVMARSFAGLVTLQPMPSYLDSLPIKMFEYMSAELPVIASNFPLWRGIVETHGCGVCVNPADPAAIADAIRALRDAPERVREMGRAGNRAVHEVFNWPQAERELLAFYATLLSP